MWTNSHTCRACQWGAQSPHKPVQRRHDDGTAGAADGSTGRPPPPVTQRDRGKLSQWTLIRAELLSRYLWTGLTVFQPWRWQVLWLEKALILSRNASQNHNVFTPIARYWNAFCTYYFKRINFQMCLLAYDSIEILLCLFLLSRNKANHLKNANVRKCNAYYKISFPTSHSQITTPVVKITSLV